MKEFLIGSVELSILEALETYRYLTADQLAYLGVGRSRSHLYKVLRFLARRKPASIVTLPYGVHPTFGRLANLHALTSDGAAVLAEARSREAKLAIKRPTLIVEDYFHRVGCVDFHIDTCRWAQRNDFVVDLFDAYYHPVPGVRGRPKPKCAISVGSTSFTPDAIFALTDQGRVKRLFAFEYYRTPRSPRTTYISRQLQAYLPALDDRVIEDVYRYDAAIRVLVVVDDERTVETVQRAAQTSGGFEEFDMQFYIKTRAGVREEFLHGWHHFDGAEVSLFQVTS